MNPPRESSEYDRRTGVAWQASLFVSVLGACSYIVALRGRMSGCSVFCRSLGMARQSYERLNVAEGRESGSGKDYCSA